MLVVFGHPKGSHRRLPIARRFVRRGGVTLWTIITIPALMILLCFVVEIGNLWYARVQVETSLEAAALSAVKTWGDDPGLLSTLPPRCDGVEYARVNPAGGDSVTIDPNYDGTKTNGNKSPDGDLIFGAITSDEAPWVFNANIEPNCAAGTVLFDATGNGNLSAQNNEWGIAYQRTDASPMPSIRSIEIDLRDGTTIAFSGALVYGDAAPPAVDDGSGNTQPNFFGLTTGDISYTLTAKKLTFEFPNAVDPATFQPCERFRFGLDVRNTKNNQQVDGDKIGQNEVKVTVYFDNNTSATGNFTDTRSNDATCDFVGTDPNCPNSKIIVNGIPDLPCPAIPGQGNNPDGQAYVRIGGSGGDKFGVRAQAEVTIPTVCENLFGIPLPDFKVHVATTAMFDCSEPGETRLIRVLPQNYTPPAP